MSRRALTLLLAGIFTVLLAAGGALVPVPYVALTPGPTTNTLGRSAQGKPLITIEGRQIYDDGGHLNFTTVAYRGGPGNRIDMFTALRGWLDPSTAIVPEETIFPRNESKKQVEQETTRQMVDSQQDSVAAALTELKIPYGFPVVDTVQSGLPAAGRLRPGDKIVDVGGTPVSSASAVTDTMRRYRPGDTVAVTVERGGKRESVQLKTAPSPEDAGRAVIGITLREDFRFPVKVQISVGDVGGPSAGLMFSLAIVDKLTPGSMTGGRFIAGTGTITPSGRVGPIGGIQQKMIAARRAGATVFLTPKDNCDEALPARPDGLRLIRADTLHSAVTSLDALRTGRGSVPSCGTS
ncbi:PDZ/DHR/GLGF domain-containing protein [Actinomadura craniellae]|uniref:endopeptidase La n=1 Tax=Actinomadura craniellae TaxID=2231787 RepID=A0A365H2S1_9ACTN|nr:PDZ domain-containing protein [Actinomadura craniellae]RAY13328.1 PDZ/DHR/GLGF domain-containing protein [Actinomadura craniellae]